MSTSLALGVEKTPCKEVTEKCDAALEARKKELKASEDATERAQQLAGECNLDRTRLEESNKKPHKNPFLMGAVGATAGLIVGGPVAILIGLLGGLIF